MTRLLVLSDVGARCDGREGSETINPRYVAYAAAHGHDPEAMMIRDEVAWPGGRMAGFLTWLPEQYRCWAAKTGEKPDWGDHWSDAQLDRFDKWLAATFKRDTAGGEG